MDQKQPSQTNRRMAIPQWLIAIIFLAGLFMLFDTNAAYAQTGPSSDIVWYLDQVRFNTGGTLNGTFRFDTTTNKYFDIDITSNTRGKIVRYKTNHTTSPGNERYMGILPEAPADLNGIPTVGMTFAISLTTRGGFIAILPGPRNLSFQGVCDTADCRSPGGPDDEIVSGHIIGMRGPMTSWQLDNVRFDTGGTASGTFKYHPESNRYFNIDIVTTANGNTGTNQYGYSNLRSRAINDRHNPMVPELKVNATGFTALTFNYAVSITHDSNVRSIDMLTGPGRSFQGFCPEETCLSPVGPYQQVLPGARIVRMDGPQTWYLEGMKFENDDDTNGGEIWGSFKYDQPSNTYSEIDITADNNLVTTTTGSAILIRVAI